MGLRTLGRELRRLSEAEGEPIDPKKIEQIVKALTGGRVKVHQSADGVRQYLQSRGLGAHFELKGPHDLVRMSINLDKPDDSGGYGFNPKSWTPDGFRAAMAEFEEVLKTAEHVWALAK